MSVMKAAILCWKIAFLLSAGWFFAGTVHADVITRRTINLVISKGVIERSVTFRVLLENRDDARDWSRYGIWLDQEKELLRSVALVFDARGKKIRTIRQSRNLRVESPGRELYQSQWQSVIPIPDLEAGQSLEVSYSIRETPYYPTFSLAVGLKTPQQNLEVTVTSDDPGMRWILEGDRQGLKINEGSPSLHILGEDIPGYRLPAYAPSFFDVAPVLRLTMNSAGSWDDVGDWYRDLLTQLPEDEGQVAELAARLVSQGGGQAQALETLTSYVRGKVRYEAVEIGIGGFKPSPGSEVLHRGWGDCKDKAYLLSRMLDTVGIPSDMVLLYSGYGTDINTDFPDPFQFNHAILAVPEEYAPEGVEEAVVDGYLFIDPTWQRGTTGWLPPADRGREVLRVGREESRLVYLPEVSRPETTMLSVVGKLSADGDLTGQLRLEITGVSAVRWQELLATLPESGIQQRLGTLIQKYFPSGQFTDHEARISGGITPMVVFQGSLKLPGIARYRADVQYVMAGRLDVLPVPAILDERDVPVILPVGRHLLTMDMALPEDWCPVVEATREVDTSLGGHRVEIEERDGHLLVRREMNVTQSWIDPDQFPELRRLMISSLQADRRPIRLRCSGSTDS